MQSRIVVWLTVQVKNKSVEIGRVAQFLESLHNAGHIPPFQLLPALNELAKIANFDSPMFSTSVGTIGSSFGSLIV